MQDQAVVCVCKIAVRRGGAEIKTRHIITTSRPESGKVTFTSCYVHACIPDSRLCFKCQQYGHVMCRCHPGGRGAIGCTALLTCCCFCFFRAVRHSPERGLTTRRAWVVRTLGSVPLFPVSLHLPLEHPRPLIRAWHRGAPRAAVHRKLQPCHTLHKPEYTVLVFLHTAQV